MNYENLVSAVKGVARKYQRENPNMYVIVKDVSCGLKVLCAPKEQMREQWIHQMLTEYSEDFEDWSEVILCDKNRKIMVVQFEDCWGDRSGYGISKCSPTDQFDEEIGLAVAFAHFREYPIPDFI